MSSPSRVIKDSATSPTRPQAIRTQPTSTGGVTVIGDDSSSSNSPDLSLPNETTEITNLGSPAIFSNSAVSI